MKIKTCISCFALLAMAGSLSQAAPLGTAFTYQGSLQDGGSPAQGVYDLQFSVYDAVAGGALVGGPITHTPVTVTNGLFTVVLDFGAGVFTGNARWLEIGVRTNGGGGFTTLGPRQPLTPSPYALYAGTAPLADGSVTSAKILDGTIATADLGANAVTSAKILDGTITGADLANNTVGSAQLADLLALGDSSTAGKLDVYRAATGVPAITLDGGDGSIRTIGSDGTVRVALLNGTTYGGLYLYTTNGSNRAYIVGSSTGGEISAYAGDGSLGARIYGDSGGGGLMNFYNDTGNVRLSLDGLGNSGGGQINLYTGEGKTAAILYGDVGGGAQMYLYNTNNGMRLWLDGYGASGGGQIQALANDGSYTINLQADDGNGAGLVQIKNNAGSTRVALAGETASGGGEISVYDTDGTETIELLSAYTSTLGGKLTLRQANGTVAVDLYAEAYANDGGLISIKNALGNERIELDGDDGDGGAAIRLKNINGVTTITLDGDGPTGVNGRITTQELQITGGSDLSEHFDIQALENAPRPGMVVCIDPSHPGELTVSSRAYDRTVAGVISGAGGVNPGMLMGQSGTKADGKHPVALTGRVYCLADTANGAIQPGDLLTTSGLPGHAMKVTDPGQAQGAIIGKAMTALDHGQGLVLVLVSLQ